MSIMSRKTPNLHPAGRLVKALRAAWDCIWQHREVISLVAALLSMGTILGPLLLRLLSGG